MEEMMFLGITGQTWYLITVVIGMFYMLTRTHVPAEVVFLGAVTLFCWSIFRKVYEIKNCCYAVTCYACKEINPGGKIFLSGASKPHSTTKNALANFLPEKFENIRFFLYISNPKSGLIAS